MGLSERYFVTNITKFAFCHQMSSLSKFKTRRESSLLFIVIKATPIGNVFNPEQIVPAPLFISFAFGVKQRLKTNTQKKKNFWYSVVHQKVNWGKLQFMHSFLLSIVHAAV